MELGGRVVSRWTLEPYEVFPTCWSADTITSLFRMNLLISFQKKLESWKSKVTRKCVYSWFSCPGRHLEISETDLRWLQGELDKLRWDAKQRMLSNTGRLFNPCGSCHDFLSGQFVKIQMDQQRHRTIKKESEMQKERVKKLVISALLVSVNWKVLSTPPSTNNHHSNLERHPTMKRLNFNFPLASWESIPSSPSFSG